MEIEAGGERAQALRQMQEHLIASLPDGNEVHYATDALWDEWIIDIVEYGFLIELGSR